MQAKINAAPSGSTVRASGCVYREKITINKPLTLVGSSGSEIRGSDVWRNWTSNGSYWVSAERLPSLGPGKNVRCISGTNRCLRPQQVFVNGVQLRQVTSSSPQSGQFYVNGEGRVILRDNPSGKTVEVSVRRQWLSGAANNATVKNFVMKHAANPRDLGAITNQHTQNKNFYGGWTIENNKLYEAASAAVVLKGSNNRLLYNEIARSGQIGVHGGGSGIVVRGNKIFRNNTEAFDPLWEAGGVKFSGSSNITMDSNEVANNDGPGLWADVDSTGITFSNNRINNNGRSGILFESSSGAEIYGNKVWENGWVHRPGPWTPGISIEGSKNADIRNNVVAWNAGGISVINMQRKYDRHENVSNVKVRSNRIIAEQGTSSLWWIQENGWFGGTIGKSGSGNVGYDNRYWYPDLLRFSSTRQRFRWVHSNIDVLRDTFNNTPGEDRAYYMSGEEKGSLLSSNGVPSGPGSR